MILLITEVTVPSNYEYISGTVNGTDTSFVADTIIEGLCLCSCEESTTYSCVLNFYAKDDTLISTVTKTATQDANVFIYDRTQADVDQALRLRASGRAHEATNLKGCLNISDINRTLDNMTVLGVLDDETMDIEVVPEFPETLFFQSFLDNAQIVKDSGYQLSGSPDIPHMPLNNFEKWNALEQIFFDNFDIRTTRFQYFGMPLRENVGINPLFIIYNGLGYQVPMGFIKDYALPSLGNLSIVESLIRIQNMLDYEYEETTNIRTVDGDTAIRVVDGSNVIRKVDN